MHFLQSVDYFPSNIKVYHVVDGHFIITLYHKTLKYLVKYYPPLNLLLNLKPSSLVLVESPIFCKFFT